MLSFMDSGFCWNDESSINQLPLSADNPASTPLRGVFCICRIKNSVQNFDGSKTPRYNAQLFGQLAQLVEQRIENPRVRGSIPRLATIYKSPNPFRAFSRLLAAPVQAGLRRFASRAAPPSFPRFWPSLASLFSVFIWWSRERERGHFLYWRGFSVGWLWLATPVAGATQRKNLRVAMRWVDPGLERSSPAIAFR